MPAETYGVLLVSFSKHSHQQHFIPLYQAHPRLRIIGVADYPDIDPDLRAYNQQWAGQLGVPYSEDLNESIDDPAIDIVSVGCEIERRSALIVRAAEAGKHLWIDKFPGATLAESEASAAAVERAGVRAIIPGYAYGTLAQHTRQVLASGDLGTLLGVHVDVMFGKGWPRPITQRRAFVAPNGRWKYPDIKRELLTVGAYAVGLIQECLGPIRHVVGHAGAFFFPEHGAHGCDDFGTLTMTDADGRVATLCGGRIGTASHPSRRAVASVPNRHPPERHHRRQKTRARRLSARLQHRLRLSARPSRSHAVAWRSARPNRRPIRGHSGPGSRARRFGRRYRRRPTAPLWRTPSAGFDGNYSRWLPRRRVQRGR